jgi:tryptophanyl-tRNA synthetase|tara:strand:- start:132881 stop:133888 length:1008 start_codon:yes stop_codon:yes gene_type:complete
MSKQNITLTGITTTGTPHLGNYLGAIKPAIEASKAAGQYFYFLADYHALIKTQDADRVHQSTKEIAAAWLALGLDTDKAAFYRQSDIPEIPELTWFLTCVAAKGLMNRAHAYKDGVQKNLDAGEDPDSAINMGLFSYPILMAADILVFNATHVPVGRDQIQHIEMARDIAQRFNHLYGKHFNIPEAVIGKEGSVVKGLDGRKMSKSYDNTIPLFLGEKKLQKYINKIKTNLLEPGEPKDADDSAVFQLWSAFANEGQTQWMRDQFAEGIAWGEAKKQLFELIDTELQAPRALYMELLKAPDTIEEELQKGAEKARALARPLLDDLRNSVGIRPLG